MPALNRGSWQRAAESDTLGDGTSIDWQEAMMNRRGSTTEVEQNLTSILHHIEEGETFVVTSDGKEVARIVPAEAFDVDSEKAKQARKELFERLQNTNAIDIGPWTRAELYQEGE